MKALENERKKKEEELIREKELLEEELAKQKLKETQEKIINCKNKINIYHNLFYQNKN